jgi:CO/xanthine dehydrogenase FAD-binding subunit
MEPLEYHRPKTMDEALALVQRGHPLGGGTSLTPRRLRLGAVVDLQDLELDGLRAEAGHLVIGGGIRLQTVVEMGDPIPAALAEACRREAALNLRNMATLAGTIVGADGRSPTAAVMLAAGAVAILEPGSEKVPLDELFERRRSDLRGRLIVSFLVPRAVRLAYAQVARSPLDRPIVCLALGETDAGKKGGRLCLALGGFGKRPILLVAEKRDAPAVSQAASRAFAQADDAWASGEYRSEVASVLARRLVEG